MISAVGAVARIARRELLSYFLQPLAWVILTALWFFTGLSFWFILGVFSGFPAPAIELQQDLFRSMLFWLPLLVALPLLAMRLIAEERQTGTLETLLTAPVSETQVTLGKYLAALAFYVVILLPFLLYLAVLARFGEVDPPAAASGLAGMLLIGGYLLAASLCASALARNQIVAAIVGFILVLLIYIGPLFAAQLARADTVVDAWNHVNLWFVLDSFSRGVVSSRQLVYPLSGIVFFLFLTARLLEAAKGR